MKLWVIGSAGMLGKAFLETCRREQIDVIGTTRSQADVTSFSSLESACSSISPTHIVNCAAFTDVDGAEKKKEEAYAVNAEGAENIAKLAKQSNTRLIHISTDYVFNGKGTEPYREEESCAPINVYGQSKRDGEIKVLEALPTACIVRTSWLFGKGGKNFISSVLDWLQKKEELQVVSDQCGRPTYCQDLADALLALLDAEGVFHFASEGAASRYEIACQMKEIATKLNIPMKCRQITPVLSTAFPTPATRPAYSVLSTQKYTDFTRQIPRFWTEAIEEELTCAL